MKQLQKILELYSRRYSTYNRDQLLKMARDFESRVYRTVHGKANECEEYYAIMNQECMNCRMQGGEFLPMTTSPVYQTHQQHEGMLRSHQQLRTPAHQEQRAVLQLPQQAETPLQAHIQHGTLLHSHQPTLSQVHHQHGALLQPHQQGEISSHTHRQTQPISQSNEHTKPSSQIGQYHVHGQTAQLQLNPTNSFNGSPKFGNTPDYETYRSDHEFQKRESTILAKFNRYFGDDLRKKFLRSYRGSVEEENFKKIEFYFTHLPQAPLSVGEMKDLNQIFEYFTEIAKKSKRLKTESGSAAPVILSPREKVQKHIDKLFSTLTNLNEGAHYSDVCQDIKGHITGLLSTTCSLAPRDLNSATKSSKPIVWRDPTAAQEITMTAGHCLQVLSADSVDHLKASSAGVDSTPAAPNGQVMRKQVLCKRLYSLIETTKRCLQELDCPHSTQRVILSSKKRKLTSQGLIEAAGNSNVNISVASVAEAMRECFKGLNVKERRASAGSDLDLLEFSTSELRKPVMRVYFDSCCFPMYVSVEQDIGVKYDVSSHELKTTSLMNQMIVDFCAATAQRNPSLKDVLRLMVNIVNIFWFAV